jgi:diacylglycerol kinase (ATP)
VNDSGSGARNKGERLVVIANPRAGAGRAGRERMAIERAVGRAFEHAEVLWTDGPGHAEALAREAAARADVVAALGGDGTCHEVVNGLVGAPRRVVFGTVPFGTGGDLVRSLSVPRRVEDALWVLSTGITVAMDVGRVTRGGGPPRVFGNVSGAGANAEVAALANAGGKQLGGFLTFLAATLRVAVRYRARPARWRWAEPCAGGETVERELHGDLLAGFVANGHWCGGGVRVGPEGSISDGLFELTIIPGMALPRTLAAIPHLYDGRIAQVPGVLHRRVAWVEVDGEMGLEADGETRFDPGTGPIRWDVVPRGLQVRGGWLKPPAGRGADM